MHEGVPVGSLGRCAAVSFNGNKIMTTSGGGALLTDDSRLAEYAAYLSSQAREPVAHYEHREIGFNYRLSNLLAALGRAQLTRLESMIERRRHNRTRYADSLASHDGIAVFGAENAHRDNAWLTAILVDESLTGFTAGHLGQWLAASGIETRPLWKPMHLQPVFRDAPMVGGQVAEDLFATGLTLPSGSTLSDAQLDRVIEAVGELLCGGPQSRCGRPY